MGFLKSDFVKILVFALVLIPTLTLFAPIILFVQSIVPCNIALNNVCGLFLIITAGLFLFVIYIISSILVFVFRNVIKKNI